MKAKKRVSQASRQRRGYSFLSTDRIQSFLTRFNPIRLSTAFTLFFFLISSSGLAQPPQYPSAVLPISSPNEVLWDEIEIPQELGTLQSRSIATASGPGVLIIQDAHAITDAQRSIHKLIEYFHKHYGIRTVGLEGASAELDPQIFRSFPNQKILRRVFAKYLQAGELAGGAAAAIFSQAGGRYFGIEDWTLYEQGIRRYQKAIAVEGAVLERISDLKRSLQTQKKTAYSKQLWELDMVLERFYENHAHLPDTLKQLADIQPPPPQSELAILLTSQNSTADGQSAGKKETAADDQARLTIEVSRLAETIQRHLEKNAFSGEARAALMELNQKSQDFKTSQMEPQAFALYLKKVAARESLFVQVSKVLEHSAQTQQKLENIKGTKLFDDFEAYAAEVQKTLMQTETEKSLDAFSRRLRLIEGFAKLELSSEQWSEVKRLIREQSSGMQRAGDHERSVVSEEEQKIIKMLEPHFEFYETANARDDAFMKNIISLMIKEKTEQMVIVTGGFHAHDLSRLFQENGISSVLIMPTIETLPDETTYRNQMQGDVSWKDYFEVENGKINLYQAFVRATRDRLLKEAEGGRRKGEGIRAEGGRRKVEGKAGRGNALNLSSAALRLVKEWRDQIIRDLAEQGRIEQSGQYTRFIDELTQGRPQTNGLNTPPLVTKAIQFADGLRKLQAGGQLTQENILGLLRPATTIQVVGVAPFQKDLRVSRELISSEIPVQAKPSHITETISIDNAAARSEVRMAGDPYHWQDHIRFMGIEGYPKGIRVSVVGISENTVWLKVSPGDAMVVSNGNTLSDIKTIALYPTESITIENVATVRVVSTDFNSEDSLFSKAGLLVQVDPGITFTRSEVRTFDQSRLPLQLQNKPLVYEPKGWFDIGDPGVLEEIFGDVSWMSRQNITRFLLQPTIANYQTLTAEEKKTFAQQVTSLHARLETFLQGRLADKEFMGKSNAFAALNWEKDLRFSLEERVKELEELAYSLADLNENEGDVFLGLGESPAWPLEALKFIRDDLSDNIFTVAYSSTKKAPDERSRDLFKQYWQKIGLLDKLETLFTREQESHLILTDVVLSGNAAHRFVRGYLIPIVQQIVEEKTGRKPADEEILQRIKFRVLTPLQAEWLVDEDPFSKIDWDGRILPPGIYNHLDRNIWGHRIMPYYAPEDTEELPPEDISLMASIFYFDLFDRLTARQKALEERNITAGQIGLIRRQLNEILYDQSRPIKRDHLDKILADLMDPDTGMIRLASEDIDIISPDNRIIGPINRAIAHLYYKSDGTFTVKYEKGSDGRQLLHRVINEFPVTPDGKSLVLIRRFHRDPAQRTSNIPGGHVPAGASEDDTAPKEISEELGIVSETAKKLTFNLIGEHGQFKAARAQDREDKSLYTVRLSEDGMAQVAAEQTALAELWQSLIAQFGEAGAETKFIENREALQEAEPGKGEIWEIIAVPIGDLYEGDNLNEEVLRRINAGPTLRSFLEQPQVREALKVEERSEVRVIDVYDKNHRLPQEIKHHVVKMVPGAVEKIPQKEVPAFLDDHAAWVHEAKNFDGVWSGEWGFMSDEGLSPEESQVFEEIFQGIHPARAEGEKQLGRGAAAPVSNIMAGCVDCAFMVIQSKGGTFYAHSLGTDLSILTSVLARAKKFFERFPNRTGEVAVFLGANNISIPTPEGKISDLKNTVEITAYDPTPQFFARELAYYRKLLQKRESLENSVVDAGYDLIRGWSVPLGGTTSVIFTRDGNLILREDPWSVHPYYQKGKTFEEFIAFLEANAEWSREPFQPEIPRGDAQTRQAVNESRILARYGINLKLAARAAVWPEREIDGDETQEFTDATGNNDLFSGGYLYEDVNRMMWQRAIDEARQAGAEEDGTILTDWQKRQVLELSWANVVYDPISGQTLVLLDAEGVKEPLIQQLSQSGYEVLSGTHSYVYRIGDRLLVGNDLVQSGPVMVDSGDFELDVEKMNQLQPVDAVVVVGYSADDFSELLGLDEEGYDSEIDRTEYEEAFANLPALAFESSFYGDSGISKARIKTAAGKIHRWLRQLPTRSEVRAGTGDGVEKKGSVSRRGFLKTSAVAVEALTFSGLSPNKLASVLAGMDPSAKVWQMVRWIRANPELVTSWALLKPNGYTMKSYDTGGFLVLGTFQETLMTHGFNEALKHHGLFRGKDRTEEISDEVKKRLTAEYLKREFETNTTLQYEVAEKLSQGLDHFPGLDAPLEKLQLFLIDHMPSKELVSAKDVWHKTIFTQENVAAYLARKALGQKGSKGAGKAERSDETADFDRFFSGTQNSGRYLAVARLDQLLNRMVWAALNRKDLRADLTALQAAWQEFTDFRSVIDTSFREKSRKFKTESEKAEDPKIIAAYGYLAKQYDELMNRARTEILDVLQHEIGGDRDLEYTLRYLAANLHYQMDQTGSEVPGKALQYGLLETARPVTLARLRQRLFEVYRDANILDQQYYQPLKQLEEQRRTGDRRSEVRQEAMAAKLGTPITHLNFNQTIDKALEKIPEVTSVRDLIAFSIETLRYETGLTEDNLEIVRSKLAGLGLSLVDDQAYLEAYPVLQLLGKTATGLSQTVAKAIRDEGKGFVEVSGAGISDRAALTGHINERWPVNAQVQVDRKLTGYLTEKLSLADTDATKVARVVRPYLNITRNGRRTQQGDVYQIPYTVTANGLARSEVRTAQSVGLPADWQADYDQLSGVIPKNKKMILLGEGAQEASQVLRGPRQVIGVSFSHLADLPVSFDGEDTVVLIRMTQADFETVGLEPLGDLINRADDKTSLIVRMVDFEIADLSALFNLASARKRNVHIATPQGDRRAVSRSDWDSRIPQGFLKISEIQVSELDAEAFAAKFLAGVPVLQHAVSFHRDHRLLLYGLGASLAAGKLDPDGIRIKGDTPSSLAPISMPAQRYLDTRVSLGLGDEDGGEDAFESDKKPVDPWRWADAIYVRAWSGFLARLPVFLEAITIDQIVYLEFHDVLPTMQVEIIRRLTAHGEVRRVNNSGFYRFIRARSEVRRGAGLDVEEIKLAATQTAPALVAVLTDSKPAEEFAAQIAPVVQDMDTLKLDTYLDFLIADVRLKYAALQKAASDSDSIELKETYEAVLAAMKAIAQAVRTKYPDYGVRVAVSMSESNVSEIQIYGDALKELGGLFESIAIQGLTGSDLDAMMTVIRKAGVPHSQPVRNIERIADAGQSFIPALFSGASKSIASKATVLSLGIAPSQTAPGESSVNADLQQIQRRFAIFLLFVTAPAALSGLSAEDVQAYNQLMLLGAEKLSQQEAVKLKLIKGKLLREMGRLLSIRDGQINIHIQNLFVNGLDLTQNPISEARQSFSG